MYFVIILTQHILLVFAKRAHDGSGILYVLRIWHHVATCWVLLAKFGHFKNLSQHHSTCRSTSRKGAERPATCYGHLSIDSNSHIFQHLQQSQACRCLADKTCFSFVDCAPNKLQLLLKEAMHIKWENPTLNKQLKHADLSLSF